MKYKIIILLLIIAVVSCGKEPPKAKAKINQVDLMARFENMQRNQLQEEATLLAFKHRQDEKIVIALLSEYQTFVTFNPVLFHKDKMLYKNKLLEYSQKYNIAPAVMAAMIIDFKQIEKAHEGTGNL
jgi:hypothetical protein